MSPVDYLVIGIYLLAMILLSLYLGRGQTTQEEYYIGGRQLPWWAIGISTMATQTSAVSFISIPAFVALKNNGGSNWLQYELAVPIAMIVVSAFLIPYFRRLRLISLYHYLEMRFSKSVRKTISAIFLLSRGLGTGVGVYAIALVLSVTIDLHIWVTILLVGVITIIYDTIGGIKAVIYSDVIQTVILLFGVLFCIGFSISSTPDFFHILAEFPKERLIPLDFSSGIQEEKVISFWPFFFGGLFLYSSYYGTDQSQVQRELAASSADEVNKSLLFNGLARFPLTLLYCFMGISIWIYFYSRNLQFGQQLAGNPDALVPTFILELPPVIKGILFSSIFAAAMSSLDSALNSLSAATMQDFLGKVSDKKQLLYSKITTVVWGLLITGFAFYVGDIEDTVIESINKIGSAFYGPVLAVFLAGILLPSVSHKSIIVSILAGVGFNLSLWLFSPEVHWMWWNVFGSIITLIFAVTISYFINLLSFETVRSNLNFEAFQFRGWNRYYTILTVYFVILLTAMLFVYHWMT